MTSNPAIYFLMLILFLNATGCVTEALWAPESQEVVTSDDGGWTYEDSEASSADESASGKPLSVWAKIGLTPFTILIDIVTSPIQNLMRDSSDSHEEEREMSRIKTKNRDTFKAAKPLNTSSTESTAPWGSSDR